MLPGLALFPSWFHIPMSFLGSLFYTKVTVSPFSFMFLLAFDYFSLSLCLVPCYSLTRHQLWNASEVYSLETPEGSELSGASASSPLLLHFLLPFSAFSCSLFSVFNKVSKDDMENTEFMSFKENIFPEQTFKEGLISIRNSNLLRSFFNLDVSLSFLGMRRAQLS